MKKHDRDLRPESFRPDENSIVLGDTVRSNHGWRRRWEWIRPTIGPTMCELQRLIGRERRSLGCIKVRDVSQLVIEPAEGEWSDRKRAILDQLVLFDPVGPKLEKIPYVFKYRYRCEASNCPGHLQSIIDWELMELYRNVRASANTPDEILDRIRQKYLHEMCGRSKDTHFFVGNHSRRPRTFMVLGVFWPPKAPQQSLF